MYSNIYFPIWNPSAIPFELFFNMIYNKNNKSVIEMFFYGGVDLAGKWKQQKDDSIKKDKQSEEVSQSVETKPDENERKKIPEPPKTEFRSLKTIFKPKSAGYPWAKAIRIAVSMGGPLLAGALMGQVSLGLIAAIGSLSNIYVNNEPYLQRAKRIIAMGFGLMLAIGLGILAGGNVWLTAFTIGSVGTLAFFLCEAWRIPKPSGYFFVLVCSIATGFPLPPSAAPLVAGIAGIGGVWAWLLAMAGAPLNPRKPETDAVKNAYLEVAAFLEYAHEPEAVNKQHNAMLALRSAQEAVQAAEFRRTPRTGKTARLRKLIYQANSLYLAAVEVAEESKGKPTSQLSDAVYELADGVLHPVKAKSVKVPDPVKDTAARRRVKKELKAAKAIAQEETAELGQLTRFKHQSVSNILKSALHRKALTVPISLRMGIALVVATLIAVALGEDRPYWVPLTCAAVLNGATPANIFHRTIQRSVGTGLGIFIGAALLSIQTNPYMLILFIMVLQFFIQFAIIRNYGFGVTFITPLALLMAESGSGGLSGLDLISARLLDTITGAVIGLIAGLVLWNRASSTRLPFALGDLIRLEGQLLQRLFKNPEEVEKSGLTKPLSDMRRDVETALLNVHAVYEVASGEPTRKRSKPVVRWPAVVAAQRIGYLVVAAAKSGKTEFWERHKERQLEKVIRQLSYAASKQQQPKEHLEIPEMESYPAIHRELRALQEAL